MTNITKMALLGVMAVAFIDVTGSVAVAQSQTVAPLIQETGRRVCLNQPPRSLTDTTTESEDALRRIDSIGNRCVYSTRTGRHIGQSEIMDFLQTNPDARDITYGGILTTGQNPGQ
jgi:hypothetical protein